MTYDKELVAEKLRRWDKYLSNYRMPPWESIPDLGLYMEQVILLLQQYLDYLPLKLKEDPLITAATINNYVRMKIMPEPRKKRYYRIHLAYLILIMTLKQSLSIQMIGRLIPVGQSEEQIEQVYRAYAERHRAVTEYFVEQVRLLAAPILGHTPTTPISAQEPEELVVMSAMFGGLSRLLSEKLLLLEGTSEEEDNKQEGDAPTASSEPEKASAEESATQPSAQPAAQPTPKRKKGGKTKPDAGRDPTPSGEPQSEAPDMTAGKEADPSASVPAEDRENAGNDKNDKNDKNAGETF